MLEIYVARTCSAAIGVRQEFVQVYRAEVPLIHRAAYRQLRRLARRQIRGANLTKAYPLGFELTLGHLSSRRTDLRDLHGLLHTVVQGGPSLQATYRT